MVGRGRVCGDGDVCLLFGSPELKEKDLSNANETSHQTNHTKKNEAILILKILLNILPISTSMRAGF
jgi:hypothetical protein